MNAINTKDLSVVINGTPILKDINLQIEKGKVTAIIGPSGAGKTTLLRTFNYLQPFASGSITVNDVELTPKTATKKLIYEYRLQSAMVFQRFNLFRNMTAVENVMAPELLNNKLKWDAAHTKAQQLLTEMGLANVANNYPVSLSGGQQQRVAIARAIASQPSIILFDEPTSALDPEMSKEVLNIISKLAQQSITMVIVTHEIEFAREVSDSTVFLEDGAVKYHGSTDELFSEHGPDRIKNFTKEMHFKKVEELS